MKGNKIQGCVVNTSTEAITIPKGVPLGEIHLDKEDDYRDQRIHLREVLNTIRSPKDFKWVKPDGCICEQDLDGDTFHLAERNGYSSLRLSSLDFR
jgi:hypothetical protein